MNKDTVKGIDFAFPEELCKSDSRVPDGQNRPPGSDCFSPYTAMHSFKITIQVGYTFTEI